jgi:protein O-mannosyl-transferase
MKIQEFMNNSSTRSNKSFLIILLIITSTLAVYYQVINHEFCLLDDDIYITINDHVRSGLTWENLIYAFGFSKSSYWHPLTWLSHQLDCELFGLNPGPHHLINVLFHIMNSVILFVLLMKMTGSQWRSTVVALMFALHPVNVDSVAWAAERKNVLSTFFWMLTMLSYLYYVKNPRISKYLLMLCIFILGLLSKPMLVTLPFVLLLMDYWPLNRLRFVPLEQDQKSPKNKWLKFRYQGVAISRLVVEKTPLLIFSLAAIVISTQSIKWGGFYVTAMHVPMGLRIENAFVSYVLYLWKMILPINLTFFYPFPKAIPIWHVIGSGILLILISCLAVRFMFRAPYFIVGWLWFTGTLVPVSGIMQGGLWPEIAERWAYIPFIGLFIIISWGFHDLYHGRHYEKEALTISGIIVILILMMLTWKQLGYWKTDMLLCSHALKINPDNYVAHVNIGADYANQKKYRIAEYHFREALKANHDDLIGLASLGNLYADLGDKDKSVYYYSEVLRLSPNDKNANLKLGLIYADYGDLDKAIGFYSNLIRIDPKNAVGYYNMGVVFAKKGEIEKGIQYLLFSIKLNPRDPETHNSLGVILMNQGKMNDAIHHFNQAVKIDPKNKDAGNYLDMALKIRKSEGDDISKLEQRRLNEPDNPVLLQKLAVLYSSKGNNAKALDVLNRFVEVQPDDPNGYYNIACIYAKEGKVEDSIKWLTRSIDKGFKDWNLLKKDQDLNNIRGTSIYKDLINKYKG